MEIDYFLTKSEQNLIEVNKGLGWILAEFSPSIYLAWENSSRRLFFVSKLIDQRKKLDTDIDDYFLPEKLTELKKVIDDFTKADKYILLAEPRVCKWLKKKIICNLVAKIMRKKANLIFEKTTELLSHRVAEIE